MCFTEILNPSRQVSATHSPWLWKFTTKFERLPTMHNLTLLVILPVCWAYPKQYQKHRHSFLLSSRDCKTHMLRLALKKAQCLGFRLEKTQAWPHRACRLWATTDGEIVIKSLFIVNVAHLLPQSDCFVRVLLVLRWCSDTFIIGYNQKGACWYMQQASSH